MVSDGMCTTTKPVTTQSCTASQCVVPPPPPPNQAPIVNISISGTLQDGQLVTFRANATDSDGQIVSYNWFGSATGSRSVVSKTFTSGTYTVSVEVTDNDGAKTTVNYNFTIAIAPPPPPPQRSYVEEFFNLDGLSVGSSWYWNGSAWEKTGQSCQYSFAANGEIDPATIIPSNLTQHYTYVNDIVDGLALINCSLNNNYSFGSGSVSANDFQFVQVYHSSLVGTWFAEYVSPTETWWVGTNHLMNKTNYPFTW